MARHVVVKLGDLKSAGCDVALHHGAVTSSSSNSESEWVEITLPDGRSIHSVFSDCLTFECRSIQYSSNAWMELWLTDNKVPYAHG